MEARHGDRFAMVTVFAIPKPFRGPIATIQRNAIRSWVALGPACEVILFGDDEGTADVAMEFGIRHVPKVARNEYGTPLLNDLFEMAERSATHAVLCYVNSDIILMDNFLRAVDTVSHWRSDFLMVGHCVNVNLLEAPTRDGPGWEAHLRGVIRQKGKARERWGIDYVVFPRGFYGQVPPFALGRAHFDNWLIWRARALPAAVVDATCVVTAIHQDHDYSHVPGGRAWSYRGEEARRNLELAGGWSQQYQIFDATHRLTPAGLRRHFGGYFRLRSRWESGKAEARGWLRRLAWRVTGLTRPIRHPLGLRMATFQRLKARLVGQR